MAGTFRCDPDAARRLSQQLTRARSDMEAIGESQRHDLGVDRYPLIGPALQQFVEAAAKTKADLGAALENASALFDGLAEGTLDLDQMLAADISQ